jgi:hypothetical protein
MKIKVFKIQGKILQEKAFIDDSLAKFWNSAFDD